MGSKPHSDPLYRVRGQGKVDENFEKDACTDLWDQKRQKNLNIPLLSLELLSMIVVYEQAYHYLVITRTLLVALSLACLEMSFNVKGPGAVILLFRLEYKTSVVCHNVYTQKVKIARRDRLHILASNRCETFENLLHIDIAPLRSTLSGILHSKNWTMIFIGIRGPWLCQYLYT